MNSVIYIRSLLHGGAEKQALLLAESLQNEQSVIVVVHLNSKEEDQFNYQSIKNICFLQGNIFQKGISLYKILKKNKVTNLICYLPINNILGTLIGKIAGTKNILCGIRGSKFKGHIRTKLMKIICNYYDIKFISNSYLAKEKYVYRGFNPDNIIVIPNGINIPSKNYEIRRTIENKANFLLLSVGRFIPEKDYDTLIEAINILVNKLSFRNIKLVIVGYGDLENLILEKISINNLGNYITLINEPKINSENYYLSADLYISSSIHEGMSNTIMEAMSYKLPIVATDAGDSSKLVLNNINGYVAEKNSPSQIAEHIVEIFENSEKYIHYCENSFSHLQDTYSTSNLLFAYKKLLINE